MHKAEDVATYNGHAVLLKEMGLEREHLQTGSVPLGQWHLVSMSYIFWLKCSPQDRRGNFSRNLSIISAPFCEFILQGGKDTQTLHLFSIGPWMPYQYYVDSRQSMLSQIT